MRDVFWLSEEQLARIEPFFLKAHGVPRVDDLKVISGIIFVIKNGLRWRDAPSEYGPHKTLYNRFIRWSRLGVFDNIFSHLTAQDGPPDTLMIDATHPGSAPHGLQPAKKGDVPRRIGRTKGGLNSKLHAIVDGHWLRVMGRPVIMCLREGQTSDHIGARILYPAIPDGAKTLIGDKSYDSNEYRTALRARGITPDVPPRKGRKSPAGYCKTLYRQRHKVENMCARLKDWRRIATRYDRCAHTFLSAILIAAIVIYWI